MDPLECTFDVVPQLQGPFDVFRATFPRTMSTNEGTAGLELKSRYLFWQLSKGQVISRFEQVYYYIQVSSLSTQKTSQERYQLFIHTIQLKYK